MRPILFLRRRALPRKAPHRRQREEDMRPALSPEAGGPGAGDRVSRAGVERLAYSVSGKAGASTPPDTPSAIRTTLYG
jgi:hypothetical protein